MTPKWHTMLRGIWRDNSKMKYGANAHQSNGASGPDCDFMFPGLTDPCNWGTGGIDPGIAFNGGEGWTEVAVGNAPNDRRGLASSGPFTFESGSVEVIDRAFVTCWFTNGFNRNEMNEWAIHIKEFFLNNLYENNK